MFKKKKKWEPITEEEDRLRMEWNTVDGKCVLLLCEKKEGEKRGRSGGLWALQFQWKNIANGLRKESGQHISCSKTVTGLRTFR